MHVRRGHRRAAVAALLSAGLISATVAVWTAQADEVTVSQDTYRTGWDQSESGLSPASVTSADFGQQFATTLDGQVYAQPLVVGSHLIAATETNKVYGLDPASGAIQWTDDQLGAYWPAATVGCSDLTPNIGITSTPVYDPATGYVYLVAKTNDGADALHPHYYMHAVNPATGAEKPGFPVAIGGHPSNDPSATFNAAYQGQRPGLLLLGGVVYAGFGSVCDYGTFRGYLAGVSTSGVQTTLWSDETGSANNGAGIWAAGGGLTSDGPGQIIVATGNGISPAVGPGKTPPGNLAESVIRLQVQSDGSLLPTDFFSPWDATTMDANDTDFGSGGPVALPDSYFGNSLYPHLLVQMGKDGRLFLLNRDDLGGRVESSTSTANVLGMLGPYQGQWGHPAVWGGDGGYVYFIGNGGLLRAFKYGVTGSGTPALSLAGTSTGTFSYTSGSPVVTSTGATSGTAVVWAVWSSGPTGTNAELRAYSATPNSSGNLTLLWSAPIGTAVKFTTPATSGNRVYVGTRDGKILAFGRPATSVLTGSPAELGNVAVGTTGTGTLTVTASQALNVTAITATSPFAVTAPTLPAPMASGDSLSIPVSFTPGAAGAQSGTVTVTTDAGAVSFTATGNGTQPGLGSDPPSATFDDQPVGLSSTQNMQITNTGTTTETIGTVTAPSAPFTAAGLPAAGTSIAPGGSFIASVTYAPTGTGTDSDAITITSTSASSSTINTLTIPLDGTSIVGQGHLEIAPWPLDFGTTAVGSSTTLSFTVTNTGNIPVTVSKAKAPDSDFTSASPLPEGQVIGPDQVYVQYVTLTPTAGGTETGNYEITSDDGQGARYLPLTGSAVRTLPAAPTDWQLNGTATASTGSIQLTPATTNAVGSAFSTLPVPTDGLAASFTAQLSGGTGADGLTFALQNAASGRPTAVGVEGGGLGFAGMPGIGVSLSTYYQGSSANIVGIVSSTATTTGTPTYLATAPVPTSLRTGTHKVTVWIKSGVISVFVDGAKLLAYTPAAGVLPASAYAGFTAGSGSMTDVHAVSNVTIASAPAATAGKALTATPPAPVLGYALVAGKGSTRVVLKNNGLANEVITAVTAPSGGFTVTLPPLALVLVPGASVSVPISYTPSASSGTAAAGTMTVTTTGGTVSIPIQATNWPGKVITNPSAPVRVG